MPSRGSVLSFFCRGLLLFICNWIKKGESRGYQSFCFSVLVNFFLFYFGSGSHKHEAEIVFMKLCENERSPLICDGRSGVARANGNGTGNRKFWSVRARIESLLPAAGEVRCLARLQAAAL